MKAKLLCLLLALNLIGSVCYAENTVTVDSDIPAASSEIIDDSEIEQMTKDDYITFINTTLDNYSSDDKISITADAVNTRFNINEGMITNGNNAELTSKQKTALYDLLIVTYESINKYADRVNDSDEIKDIVNSVSKSSDYLFENEIYITIDNSEFDIKDYRVVINDIGIVTPWGHYSTETPQKIITDIETVIYLHKDIFLRYNISSKPADIDIFDESITAESRIIERVSFDVTLTEKHSETVFANYGKPGDTLQCSVSQTKISNDDYFIFSILNDGERNSYYSTISGLDFGTGNQGNKLEFKTNRIYDGENIIAEQLVSWKKATFVISGKSSNNQVTDVFLSVESEGMGKSIDNISTENIVYEFLSDDNTLNSKRNLHTLFGITKEEQIKKDEANQQEQNPEKYVTNMRGVYEDGEEIIDFYISFIAETYIDITTTSAPKWFQCLGGNVKATIIGVTQTLNGKDRRSYTMLRFSGDKGTQWFDNDVTEPNFDEKNNEYCVYNSFKSLLSFNGFQKIRNTVEYESTSTDLYFDNDENRTLKSIIFNIGNCDFEVSSKDINYIGGGKIAYEKLW